jgi:hypothetical protein
MVRCYYDADKEIKGAWPIKSGKPQNLTRSGLSNGEPRGTLDLQHQRHPGRLRLDKGDVAH